MSRPRTQGQEHMKAPRYELEVYCIIFLKPIEVEISETLPNDAMQCGPIETNVAILSLRSGLPLVRYDGEVRGMHAACR